MFLNSDCTVHKVVPSKWGFTLYSLGICSALSSMQSILFVVNAVLLYHSGEIYKLVELFGSYHTDIDGYASCGAFGCSQKSLWQ